MKLDKKTESAERLLDAMGLVDDLIINEAMSPPASAQRNSGRLIRRFALMAAAFMLVIGLYGGIVSRLLSGWSEGSEDLPTEKRVEAILTKAAEEGRAQALGAEEVDFFDGRLSIIWNDGTENRYHLIIVEDKNEVDRLEESLRNPDSLDEVTSDTKLRLWISYGNGQVVSPYLKDSPGNMGFSELFEYSPEVTPGEDFTRLLNELSN